MTINAHAVQVGFIKLFGGAGYVLWALQFLLLVALYFDRFRNSPAGKVVFPSLDENMLPPEPTAISAVSVPGSGIVAVLVFMLGLAFIGLVVYLIAARYVPAVSKAGSSAVYRAAEQTVTQTERLTQKKLSRRKQQLLTGKVARWLKLVVSVIPLLIVLNVAATPLVDEKLALLLMSMLSLATVVSFSMQAALQHIWRKTVKLGNL